VDHWTIWTSWLRWLRALVDNHDGMLLFLLLTIEELGIPLPVPTDVAIAWAGTRLARGLMSFPEALLSPWLGTAVGSSLLYFIGRRWGPLVLARVGHVLRLSPEKLERAERALRRHGTLGVFVLRLVPGLRVPTSFAAGAAGVPFPAFVLGTWSSALVWTSTWLWAGYAFRRALTPVLLAVHTAGTVMLAVLAAAVVLLLAWPLVQRLRRSLARGRAAA